MISVYPGNISSIATDTMDSLDTGMQSRCLGAYAATRLGAWACKKIPFISQTIKLLPEGRIEGFKAVKDLAGAFWTIPGDQRVIVTEQASRLMTPTMSGKERAFIVHILGQIPKKQIENVTSKTLALILEDLCTQKPEKIESRLKRCLIHVARNMLEVESEKGKKVLPSITIKEVESFGQKARHFLSKEMDARTKEIVWEEILQSPLADAESFLQQAPRLRSEQDGFVYQPFRELAPDLLWRLGLDRNFQSKGPHYFDRDDSLGYRKGMERGLKFLDVISPYRMNARFLKLIHDVSVDGGFHLGRPLQKGYAEGQWRYQIDRQDINPATVEQLMREWEAEKLISSPRLEHEIWEANHRHLPREKIDQLIQEKRREYGARIEHGHQTYVYSEFNGDIKKVDAIFDRFYAEAGKPGATMKAKYAAVARCCRALLVLHPFPDGNGRTVSFLLMNLLLQQIGSSPAITVCPSIFDGTQIISDLIHTIKEGVTYFQKMKLAVTIGEYLGVTPTTDRETTDYSALNEFYLRGIFPN